MEDLDVLRVMGNELVPVATIVRPGRNEERFLYLPQYLERGRAPLSLSLPLSQKSFSAHEMRPYFEGLLPEGASREALVSKVGVAEDDYLSLLAVVGLDCVGDVVIRRHGESVYDGGMWKTGCYTPLDLDDIQRITSSPFSLAESSEGSRLSLAGVQGKIGLAHNPEAPLDAGWLLPKGGAASTHILKTSTISRIAEFEVVCMLAAAQCGVRVPRVDVLPFSKPVVSVERFDRKVSLSDLGLSVERLHQEDLAQAFGYSPATKYLELEGGTYASIAQLLLRHSASPIEDIDQLARIVVFNYLVGNCDNHLKNLSVIHGVSFLRLAPAYDIVCTTFFERFSREMGARIGSTRLIDDVKPEDFTLLARDLGLGVRRLRAICCELTDCIVEALLDAGETFAEAIDSLPYSAEDIVTDMASRRTVVEAFISTDYR